MLSQEFLLWKICFNIYLFEFMIFSDHYFQDFSFNQQLMKYRNEKLNKGFSYSCFLLTRIHFVYDWLLNLLIWECLLYLWIKSWAWNLRPSPQSNLIHFAFFYCIRIFQVLFVMDWMQCFAFLSAIERLCSDISCNDKWLIWLLLLFLLLKYQIQNMLGGQCGVSSLVVNEAQ